jgi:hypothetical protein
MFLDYYLSFHNSSFALRYFLNVNGMAIVWHTPCFCSFRASRYIFLLGSQVGEFRELFGCEVFRVQNHDMVELVWEWLKPFECQNKWWMNSTMNFVSLMILCTQFVFNTLMTQQSSTQLTLNHDEYVTILKLIGLHFNFGNKSTSKMLVRYFLWCENGY